MLAIRRIIIQANSWQQQLLTCCFATQFSSWCLRRAGNSDERSKADLLPKRRTISKKPLPATPELPESELEEKFVRGRGPGGQKINKSSIVAQIKHVPTGLSVICQESRSREENRRIGRKLLARKVDLLRRGNESYLGQLNERKMKRASRRRNRAKKKYAGKNDVDKQYDKKQDDHPYDSDESSEVAQ